MKLQKQGKIYTTEEQIGFDMEKLIRQFSGDPRFINMASYKDMVRVFSSLSIQIADPRTMCRLSFDLCDSDHAQYHTNGPSCKNSGQKGPCGSLFSIFRQSFSGFSKNPSSPCGLTAQNLFQTSFPNIEPEQFSSAEHLLAVASGFESFRFFGLFFSNPLDINAF